MTLTVPVTKVPCPKCVATEDMLPHVGCTLCAGDGMVTPEVRSLYLAKRSGEYRMSIEPTESK